MDPITLFQQLAISILLGLLVGLQRERSDSDLAGFRTFPLITVFGTMCAVLSNAFNSPWILAGGFAGIIALILIGNLPKLKEERPDPGITTEAAMLVMFAVGAFLVVGPWVIAVVIAGGTAILLQMKPQLHGIATRMGDQDFRAILQFVIITFIVLPVLEEYDHNYDLFELLHLHSVFPQLTEYGKLDVLNPYEIWLMVVLVVGISLGGYVTYKIFGRNAGIGLGGILGGTISSTATTVSYARRTSATANAAGMSAVVIMIASTVVFIRILIEVSIAAPRLFPHAVGPISAMFCICLVLSGVMWFFQRHDDAELPEQSNPTEMKSAIVFALLYTVVIVAVAVGSMVFKEGVGLYAIAGLSGMTDMDAITLSTARLFQSGRLNADTSWRLIVVATMSNLVFKVLIVAVMGHKQLLKKVGALFGTAIIAGACVLAFWP